MSASRKGRLIEAGLCRCCGNLKKCRLLNAEYIHSGQKETYIDMFMDCFGLLLSHMDGKELERLICATCVVRLRESYLFRCQVLKCEEIFLQNMMSDEAERKPDVVVKIEPINELNTKSEDEDTQYDDGIETADHLNMVKGNIVREPACRVTLRCVKKSCGIGNGLNTCYVYKTDNSLSDAESKQSAAEMSRSKTKVKVSAKREESRNLRRKKLLVKKMDPEHARMKNDLLRKMKKLQQMLKQDLTKPATKKRAAHKTESRPKLSKTAATYAEQESRMDDETKSWYNLISIIENSYVFPFKNRISNFYCYYCRQIYTDPEELRQHTMTHDPKTFGESRDNKSIPKLDVTRIDCRHCAEKIDDLNDLKRHLSIAHRKFIYQTNVDGYVKFKLKADSVSCLECGQQFMFIDKLIDHMVEHFGKYVCDVCGACFIEEKTLTVHVRAKHAKVQADYPCDVCGKNYKSNYSRTMHITVVHEKKPFIHCYKCDAGFLSYAQRNRHLINVHGDKRKFPCSLCDKVFDVRKTMVEHQRKYHLQVCRHQCDVCGQRFYVPSDLKEHKTKHTGERNYRCDYCDKSYPRRQTLLEHIRSHADSKRYKCDVCLATFTQNASLKSHVKSQHQMFEMPGGGYDCQLQS